MGQVGAAAGSHGRAAAVRSLRRRYKLRTYLDNL
jgi:hypothetical protein